MAKQNSNFRDMIKKQFDYNGVKGRVGATDVAELVTPMMQFLRGSA